MGPVRTHGAIIFGGYVSQPNKGNGRSGSTTWVWESRKILAPPTGQQRVARRASDSALLSARDMREPLTMTVRYLGGAEGWWEIKARGRTYRRPGVRALHDVMLDLLELQGARDRS